MGIEIEILDWIQGLKTGFGDVSLSFISTIGNAGLIWIIMAVILLIIPKTRKCGAFMAAALIVDALLCNCILKPLVARVRPYDVNTAIELIVAKPVDYSFPSGHTAAAFAATTALFFDRKKYLWIPALILAVLTGFSRLYLYVHYPTDVLGGIIIGILSGCAGCFIVQKIINTRGAEKCN